MTKITKTFLITALVASTASAAMATSSSSQILLSCEPIKGSSLSSLICTPVNQGSTPAQSHETSATPQPTQAQVQPQLVSNPDVTVFECISMGSGYATIARRGERQTPPLITWNSYELGPQYSPEARCGIVSKRLTQVVAASGGKLKNLNLTYGRLNGQPVICHVSDRTQLCNETNLLFTLRPSDRGREREILQTLINFSVLGSGNAVQQSAALGYAPIGEEIEKFLVSDPKPPTSRPTVAPSVRPQPVKPSQDNSI